MELYALFSKLTPGVQDDVVPAMIKDILGVTETLNVTFCRTINFAPGICICCGKLDTVLAYPAIVAEVEDRRVVILRVIPTDAVCQSLGHTNNESEQERVTNLKSFSTVASLESRS